MAEADLKREQAYIRIAKRSLGWLMGYSDPIDPMKANPEFFRLGAVEPKPAFRRVPVDQQMGSVPANDPFFVFDEIRDEPIIFRGAVTGGEEKETPMTIAEPAVPAASKSLLDLLQERVPLDWMDPDRTELLVRLWSSIDSPSDAFRAELGSLIAEGVIFPDPQTTLLHFDPKAAHAYARSRDRRQEDRPSWDEMGMRTAQLWSERSSDPKVRVGACVLDHWHRVIGVGYNGRAAGEPNERESLDQGQSGFIHAEINALLATNWSDGANATLYVTHEPCASCARAIINTRRIRRVVYGESYTETARTFARLPSGAEIMRAAGLIVEQA